MEIEDLVKEFPNGVRANDGISLSVERGRIFGLLGPNGAGKTTLVDQIMALLKPTSGTIAVDGIDIVESPEVTRCLQPQNNVSIDGFTPIEVIELVGRIRVEGKSAAQKHTSGLIEGLEIEEWAEKPGQ